MPTNTLANHGPDSIDSWRCFFLSWKRAGSRDPLARALETFFERWAATAGAEESIDAAPIADVHELMQFFDCFRPLATRRRQSGALLNVWQLIRLGRSEVQHCQVLRWILDPYSDHPHGRAVLGELVRQSLAQSQVQFDVDRLTKSDYRVHTETLPLGERESRVDIEIDGDDFLILIEAKIDASEGHRQLSRYRELARSKAIGRPWLLIFLTLDGYESCDADMRAQVANLSWRQIAKTIERHSLGEPQFFYNQLLRQFADHLKKL